MQPGGASSILYAQSHRRVLGLVIHEAEANVRMGKRTPAQAFATIRRKYESMRAEYLRVPLGLEADWESHGPKEDYEAVHERLFPRAVAL